MKITITLTLGLAATVSAQSVCDPVAAAVPSCGVQCINSAAAAIGCGQGDYACQCSPASALAIQSKAQTCVEMGCSSSALQFVASVSKVCACAATAAAATEPTSAAAMTMGSAPDMPMPSATPGTATGATSEPTGGGPSAAVTSKGLYAMTPAMSMATASGSAVGTGNMTWASYSQFSGGAVAVVGSVGGVMGAIFVIIAAL